MLPRIFEMFAQADRSLERSQGGLGIGLTLVRRLVEMHGGTIEARSEGIGKGSEFVVRLPIRGEWAEPARPEYRREGPALSPLRILVVDDNHDAARSLARLLNLAGNEVQTAGDGREAVAAAAAFRPDVVLLDIGLPVLNGYDVARQIRAQPWGGDMALIALTGWGQDEDRRRSREAGFDHHLVKPVDTDTMMRLLDDLQTTPA
jgi:CheY-like chemotaxis protein